MQIGKLRSIHFEMDDKETKCIAQNWMRAIDIWSHITTWHNIFIHIKWKNVMENRLSMLINNNLDWTATRRENYLEIHAGRTDERAFIAWGHRKNMWSRRERGRRRRTKKQTLYRVIYVSIRRLWYVIAIFHIVISHV